MILQTHTTGKCQIHRGEENKMMNTILLPTAKYSLMFVTIQLELPPQPNNTTSNPHVDDAVTFQNNVMSLKVITSTGRLLLLHA
jgi:hypothetical protein